MDVGGDSPGGGRPSLGPGALVGRAREAALILAALKAERPVILIGAPGTSKTTLLQTVVQEISSPELLVQTTGDDQLTIHSLVGTHDPAAVLRSGYLPENFLAGPLTTAMTRGGILYVEELNRTPTGTLNALLTALSDGYIEVPRLGRVDAAPGFGFVGSSNPLDDVGTERLSRGLLDRFVAIHLDYQPREDEMEIVRRKVPGASDAWVAYAVDVVRQSRRHPDLRFGSSIRGSIDFLKILVHIPDVASLVREAGLAALSTKVVVRASSGRPVQDIVMELMHSVPYPDNVPVIAPASPSVLASPG